MLSTELIQLRSQHSDNTVSQRNYQLLMEENEKLRLELERMKKDYLFISQNTTQIDIYKN